jgi:hypothetical protein
VLFGVAEAHHPLDSGTVVPRPVEQHDLARGREVVDVALEVPLGALAVGGFLQRDDAGAARVEVLHEPFDGSALARGVAALEDYDMPAAVGLAPLLQLQQFDLQQPLLLLVVGALHPLVVRIVFAPGVDIRTVGLLNEHRIVVVIVSYGVLTGSIKHDHGQKVSTRAYTQVKRR